MTTSAAVQYRIDAADLYAHLFEVTLTIRNPAENQRVSLPVWIPGSYLVREFARHLQNLSGQQGGRALEIHQRNKAEWELRCQAGRPVTLRYQVYAFDNSVRTAWLDTQRGFFNGTSLCLRVHGQEPLVHALHLPAPTAPAAKRWKAATALTASKLQARGFGHYVAANYDELVDSPVEMGDFWEGEFEACGIPHRFVVAGAAPSMDGDRLIRDARQICETAIRFWHPHMKRRKGQAHQPPHTRYVFMLNVVDDSYGGLEHAASTALICGRRDLPRKGEARASDGYTTLLGLISHEYFHTWNVKRLRPAELARYDYTQENYTELLWFFEGFTSYYDDLLLRRAGLLDDAAYLKLLNKTLNQVLQTPGARVQSVAQASFDAWVKYYRQDENTPNATVSYYTKGALVALCLDLTLRQHPTSLDAVMQALWLRCAGGPMTEDDLLAVLLELTQRDFRPELQAWVHGRADLPLRTLLEQQGVAWHDDPSQMAQRLGLRVSEVSTVQIKAVLRGSAAERAGFAAGDEWWGLEVNGQGWRLGKLDDVALYAGQATGVTALVARDKRLLQLSLTLPDQDTTVRLSIQDSARVKAWLSGDSVLPQEAAQSPRNTGGRLAKKASTPSK